MVYLVVSAGIVFGFAALKPVLVDEGVYRHLCEPEELGDGVTVCYGQEIRYDYSTSIQPWLFNYLFLGSCVTVSANTSG